MCGIVGGYGTEVNAGVQSLIHRGPDAQDIIHINSITLGHTRLAILDLDSRSNQPFCYGDVALVFNGEIWNYKILRQQLSQNGYTLNTNGDTEVVAASLSKWGVDALSKLEGMFAIGWTVDGETLYLARDRFGEIPLHVAKQKPFYFASEKKALLAMGAHPLSIADIEPGHYAVVTPCNIQQVAYYDAPLGHSRLSRKEASPLLYEIMGQATAERTISDVPVCTLLSGGIDSAAVAYWLKQSIPNLVAYTAVFNPKSKDLQSARLVAQTLGIELREIHVPPPTADDISRVIHCIEMGYKAQIEIGWPCIRLAQAMRADGFKVTFSGEGSDELWASYGFAYHALQKEDWYAYRKKLFLSQSKKNFVRCNKIFMAHSIECRLPFLNTQLVEFALSLPKDAVQNGKSKPKAVIQEAYYGYLPTTITNRAKVAFQDGMGLKDAIARTITDPQRYYNAEYKRQYTTR